MEREKERGGTMGRNCLAKRRGSGANKWRATIFGAHSLEQKMEERKTLREGDGVCLGALLILNDNTRHMQMKQPGERGRPRRRRSRS